ncbi:T-cell immunoglobulin and mucin domain-containing protein 4 [Larimichthys crocea]|uniref:Uncharacterized protein n=1 Tax=Larimichthys crocea TaxID=215358 RepID=A0ACD3R589_LARCR|nr:T-cell immunoglobulin and mucin domain-containing protein 4 [Larimichthys crocea]
MKSVTRMLLLLLLLLAVSECGILTVSVVGHEGQSVTLSCKYDIKHHKPQSICWGRGDLPNTGGCKNQLISTDGYKVKTRVSSKYRLQGRLDEGDVSLTILRVTDPDAGRYGCRVHQSGLFNDEKHHIDLIIEGALPTKTITVLTTWRGSGVTSNGPTKSTVTQIQETGSTPVQQEQQVNRLPSIIGNAVRAFFITFIPTTLLTAAYVSKKRQSATVLRTNSRTETGRRLSQSVEEEEEDSPV